MLTVDSVFVINMYLSWTPRNGGVTCVSVPVWVVVVVQQFGKHQARLPLSQGSNPLTALRRHERPMVSWGRRCPVNVQW